MKKEIALLFFFLLMAGGVFAQSRKESFSVPENFSPNGDGMNDSLAIKGNCVIKYELKIYNRWGELVTQLGGEKKYWDGKIKNEEAPMGVYVWKAKVNFESGNVIKETGKFTLLR